MLVPCSITSLFWSWTQLGIAVSTMQHQAVLSLTFVHAVFQGCQVPLHYSSQKWLLIDPRYPIQSFRGLFVAVLVLEPMQCACKSLLCISRLWQRWVLLPFFSRSLFYRRGPSKKPAETFWWQHRTSSSIMFSSIVECQMLLFRETRQVMWDR